MLLSRTSTGFSLSRKVPGLPELLLEVPLGALLEDMARVHRYTWSCNDVRMPILNTRIIVLSKYPKKREIASKSGWEEGGAWHA